MSRGKGLIIEGETNNQRVKRMLVGSLVALIVVLVLFIAWLYHSRPICQYKYPLQLLHAEDPVAPGNELLIEMHYADLNNKDIDITAFLLLRDLGSKVGRGYLDCNGIRARTIINEVNKGEYVINAFFENGQIHSIKLG